MWSRIRGGERTRKDERTAVSPLDMLRYYVGQLRHKRCEPPAINRGAAPDARAPSDLDHTPRGRARISVSAPMLSRIRYLCLSTSVIWLTAGDTNLTPDELRPVARPASPRLASLRLV